MKEGIWAKYIDLAIFYFKRIFKMLSIFYVWLLCLHLYLCTMHTPFACGGRKKASDRLELSCIRWLGAAV